MLGTTGAAATGAAGVALQVRDANELLPPQHNMAMHLIRLPENQRDAKILATACAKFDRAIQIMEEQLGHTRFIASDNFTYGDIPLGPFIYRYFRLVPDHPPLPNVERWYKEISARPAFKTHVLDVPFT